MKLKLRYRCALDKCAVTHPATVAEFALPETREDLRAICHNEIRYFIRQAGRENPHAELVLSPAELPAFERIESEILHILGETLSAWLGVERVSVET